MVLGSGSAAGGAAGGEGDINFVDGGRATEEPLLRLGLRPHTTAPTVALRARWPDSVGLRPMPPTPDQDHDHGHNRGPGGACH